MKGHVMDMRRNPLLPGVVGVIVAGDPPQRELERIVAQGAEPVALKFRALDGHGDFEIPVRDLTPQEVCTVVMRAMHDQKIVFGFAPNPNQPGRIVPV